MTQLTVEEISTLVNDPLIFMPQNRDVLLKFSLLSQEDQSKIIMARIQAMESQPRPIYPFGRSCQ
jgi:hypothetical protein